MTVVDVWGAVNVDTTGGTTHTPNAATASSVDCSILLITARATANGTTPISFTAPTHWTIVASSSQPGGGASASTATAIAFRNNRTGTVTPGAFTTNVATVANVYHLLTTDITAAQVSSEVDAVSAAAAFVSAPGPQSLTPSPSAVASSAAALIFAAGSALFPIANVVSSASCFITGGAPLPAAIFDSISVGSLALIVRAVGPLERGSLLPNGAWSPDTADTDVYYDGFGISAATGRTYFDSIAASQGEQMVLVINAGKVRPYLRTA